VRSDFPGTQDTRVMERSVAKKQGEVKPRRARSGSNSVNGGSPQDFYSTKNVEVWI
jgi:hypothetical protein